MARISGVDLPRYKRIDIGLTYIFGIGCASAHHILKSLNIHPNTRCENLTVEEITSLRTIIDQKYQTEGALRRSLSQNIKRLTTVGTAKGRRHRVSLPVRGQRTRTNARTRKNNGLINKK